MIPRATRHDVEKFLTTIQRLLSDEKFDIDNDFFLIKSRKNDTEHSTSYTLLALDYDVYDVISVIKALHVEDFSEIKIDEDDPNPPLLYVFGKIIGGKEVYIKIKYRELDDSALVICVSFHFAAWNMKYMFRK